MHRKLDAELLLLDTELKRTLRKLKKVRMTEAAVMVDEIEANQNVPIAVVERPQRQKTMEYF